MAAKWNHRYALETLGSKELVSYKGRVIIHDNPRELEFLLRGSFRIVELDARKLGRPYMRLRDHPSMAAVEFPLNATAFREE